MLEELGRYEARRLFIDDGKEMGILDKAKNETELLLVDFVRSFTGKAVHVTFESSGKKAKLPSSCKPYVPSGWYYNSSKRVWMER